MEVVEAHVEVVPFLRPRQPAEAGKVLLAATILGALVSFAMVLMAVEDPSRAPIAVAWVLGTFFFAALGAYLLWRPRRTVAFRATPAGVTIGSRHVPRSRIVDGSLTEGDRGMRLELRRRFPFARIELEVGGRDFGRQILDVLGLGSEQRALTRSLGSRVAWPWPLLLLLVVGGLVGSRLLREGPYEPAGVLAWLAIATPLFALGTVPTRTTFGNDAIRERWLGVVHTTWIADITRVEIGLFDRAVVVERVGRRRRRLHVPPGLSRDERRRECARIVERIEAARTATRPGAPPDLHEWATRHHALPPAAWVAALRTDGSVYREGAAAPFTNEELLRAAEDPRADPLDRAAAAVAVWPHLDDEGRERLRAAASATSIAELGDLLEALERPSDVLPDAVRELRRVGRGR